MNKNEYQEIVSLFAQNVKKARLAKGISQESLALLTGLDRTYVSKIEREIANPSLKAVFALANELDIPFEELFRKGESKKDE